MEWDEFLQLQPGERVMTTQWNAATVERWGTSEEGHRGEVLLHSFKIPNKRCKFFARTEIKSKL